MHQQIAAFDQLNAHLLGQEGVFKVCRIKNSGSQQHHRRLVPAGRFRAQRPQRGEQSLRVMIDGANAVIAKQRGENFLQHFAVRQHVGDAARHPKIVFQHGEAPVRKPHQVGAADADVNSARHRQIAHLAPEVAATVDQFPRHDAIGENSSTVVNVLQEQIQRRDSLRESTFDLPPFVVGNDSRQQVVGKDALRALVVAVHRKCDSLMQEREVGCLLALTHFLGRQLQQRLEKCLIVRTRHAGSLEHLVIGCVELIIPEGRPKQRAGRLRRGHRS